MQSGHNQSRLGVVLSALYCKKPRPLAKKALGLVRSNLTKLPLDSELARGGPGLPFLQSARRLCMSSDCSCQNLTGRNMLPTTAAKPLSGVVAFIRFHDPRSRCREEIVSGEFTYLGATVSPKLSEYVTHIVFLKPFHHTEQQQAVETAELRWLHDWAAKVSRQGVQWP